MALTRRGPERTTMRGPRPAHFWSGGHPNEPVAAGPGPSRRAEIIRALMRRGQASVEDLAGDLGLSAGAVRNHLAALAADGLVTRRDEIAGPGRPRHMYTATLEASSVLPGRYAPYAMQVLDAARAAGVREEEFTAALAAPFGERLRAAGPGGTAAENAARVARAFDEAGFVTDAFAPGSGSAIVSIAHCPLMELARHDGIVCAAELLALRHGLPGVDVQRIDHAPAGGGACAYRLQQARAGRPAPKVG